MYDVMDTATSGARTKQAYHVEVWSRTSWWQLSLPVYLRCFGPTMEACKAMVAREKTASLPSCRRRYFILA